jgi:hypothetical protein
MNQQELEQNISELIDKYLLRTTETVSKDCSSVIIRAALEERIDEYFPKSRLNEILISKNRFKVKKDRTEIYFYNIYYRDISLLTNSKEILQRLKSASNFPFKEYTKQRKHRRTIDYKYTFKYRIKLGILESFAGLNYTEKFVCEVIARELQMNTTALISYIEMLNIDSCPDIPQQFLEKLLSIFNITHEEAITNKNYYH